MGAYVTVTSPGSRSCRNPSVVLQGQVCTWTYRTASSAFAPRLFSRKTSSSAARVRGSHFAARSRAGWCRSWVELNTGRTRCVRWINSMVAAGDDDDLWLVRARSYDTGRRRSCIPTPRYDDRLPDGARSSPLPWSHSFRVDLASCGSWADEPLRTFTLDSNAAERCRCRECRDRRGQSSLVGLQTLRFCNVREMGTESDTLRWKLLLEVVCEQDLAYLSRRRSRCCTADRVHVGAPLEQSCCTRYRWLLSDLTRLWGEDLDSLIDELVDVYG